METSVQLEKPKRLSHLMRKNEEEQRQLFGRVRKQKEDKDN